MNATNYLAAKRRVGRGRRRPAASTPPLAGPVLVSAVLVIEDNQVLLGFDQPIDIDGFDPESITVANGPAGIEFGCNGEALLQNPTTIACELEYTGIASGPSVLLTVTGANGIVSVSGGVAWAGVTALPLPFPTP